MQKLITIALFCGLALVATAQEKKIKSGLTPEDWAYKIADGVTAKEVTHFSDGVACYAKIFYPKGFSASGKTPAIDAQRLNFAESCRSKCHSLHSIPPSKSKREDRSATRALRAQRWLSGIKSMSKLTPA